MHNLATFDGNDFKKSEDSIWRNFDDISNNHTVAVSPIKLIWHDLLSWLEKSASWNSTQKVDESLASKRTCLCS